MTIYPKERKEALIAKMLAPQNISVPQLAQETGIPKDTLYGWRRQAQQETGLAAVPERGNASRWSSEEKFAVVLETATMNEAELGAYCRQRGLYAEQISRWREVCRKANDDKGTENGLKRGGEGTRAKRIKQLESELRRKEKALAEAAALLVLQKKARALWGEIEVD